MRLKGIARWDRIRASTRVVSRPSGWTTAVSWTRGRTSTTPRSDARSEFHRATIPNTSKLDSDLSGTRRLPHRLQHVEKIADDRPRVVGCLDELDAAAV